MILIIDFGSQTTHLIGRRIRELGCKANIVEPEPALAEIHELQPKGIILSGGPASVYEDGAPTIDKKIFDLNIPILGICYGLQLTAKLLDGKVIAGRKEYGPAELEIARLQRFERSDCGQGNWKFEITKNLPHKFLVWMSHGDEVVKLPSGFETIGSTEHVPFAFAANENKKVYGLQFHPEVEHTEYGTKILENFKKICESETLSQTRHPRGVPVAAPGYLGSIKDAGDIQKLEDNIKTIVGKKYVIGAVSGGVDSTVAAVLTTHAIGQQFIPVYVNNGLMREDTTYHVEKIFTKIGIKPIILHVEEKMLEKLKGIDDPEKKRKIIGAYYIELFEKEMEKAVKKGLDVEFLLQGTIYSDVIESRGTKHASHIKSHHNVGGLPAKMRLKLLEPLRNFYKDEVRKIGKMLGLPDEFVHRQVFPGPGYAIRIRGEVTKKRLEHEKQADKIILEELEKSNLLDKIYMSFPIMTGSSSTAVKGDGRFFGEVIAVRIIESTDVMTSRWAKIPYEVLQKISSRIVNEVPEISRVVYDVTTKPPATMEWE